MDACSWLEGTKADTDASVRAWFLDLCSSFSFRYLNIHVSPARIRSIAFTGQNVPFLECVIGSRNNHPQSGCADVDELRRIRERELFSMAADEAGAVDREN